jgi:thiamine transport system permease protein
VKNSAAARASRSSLVSSFALLAYAAAALAPLLVVFVAGLLRSPSIPGLLSLLAGVLQARNLRSAFFTLSQAAVSTVAALAVGLPGAWLVSHYRFPGRKALKALAAFPFSVPPVLVVLAFVLFYGRAGHLNSFLMAVFGLREPPLSFLYTFLGIVLVHGFYEFPVILQGVGEVWESLPEDREDAARLLGAGRLRAFATGTLPSLLPAIVQAAGLCFLLCFFSFAVVMIFGGLSGSTLEVEVYRRARLEADPAGAAAVAMLETIIALAMVLLIGLADHRSSQTNAGRYAGSSRSLSKPRGTSLLALIAYLGFILVFFLGPLISLMAQSLTVPQGPLGPSTFGLGNYKRLIAGSAFYKSVGDTILTAMPAAFLATGIGSALAIGLSGRGTLAKAASALPLAISSIVSALGWSLIFPRGGVFLIAWVQALGVLPFVLKGVSGALSSLNRKPTEAARTLGAGPLRAAFEIDLASVSPAVLAAAALAFASAAGDVNVPLVLAQGDFESLTMRLYRLISSHRLAEGAAAGVLLGALTSLVFLAKEGRKDA